MSRSGPLSAFVALALVPCLAFIGCAAASKTDPVQHGVVGEAGEPDEISDSPNEPEPSDDAAGQPGDVESHGDGRGGGGGGMPSLVVGSDAGSANSGDVVDRCAAEVTEAEVVPLDMYVMVDTSLSMGNAIATNSTKWSQVKSALRTFLRDKGSAGLGVGLQYFPLPKPDVPAICHDDAGCGDAAPCVTKLCFGAYAEYGKIDCLTEDDCAGYGPCIEPGKCEGDPTYICKTAGASCGVGLGVCDKVVIDGYCTETSICDAMAYATPAQPIATLPDAASTLIASLDAQMPAGNTPTGPALTGALQQAKAWAKAHPDHRVVAVLATDGTPTNCSPTNIDEVGDIAADALADDPSLKTFVIGVLSQDDVLLGAQSELDTVARGGGTTQALIVDTSQDVASQFSAALDSIRTDPLACEFKVPASASGKALDYSRVNVNFKQGKASTPLFYVGKLEDCDPDTGGWYYDVDPSKQDPKLIFACPSNCATFQSSTGASVEIALGCETIVK